jgi:Anti-sigma-K factor rskA
MTDFHDLIDTDDLSDDEEERLRRTHDLLLRIGPPPELPAGLLHPPSEQHEAEVAEAEVAETNVVPFQPRGNPRRVRVALVAAAAVAAAAFGGGYLFGHSNASGTFASAHNVPMHAIAGAGTQAVGLVKVGSIDSDGNWPLEMKVSGLPKQPAGDYYELWLTRHGKPFVSCGTFRIQGKTATVRFSVPYKLSRYGGWVVTKVASGDEPGQTLMTT